jgi:hypothetical protein
MCEKLKQAARRASFRDSMGHVYRRLSDLLRGKPADGRQLTVTLSALDWWTVVVVLERANVSDHEANCLEAPVIAPVGECEHDWERMTDLGTLGLGADAWWYKCSKCGRYNR